MANLGCSTLPGAFHWSLRGNWRVHGLSGLSAGVQWTPKGTKPLHPKCPFMSSSFPSPFSLAESLRCCLYWDLIYIQRLLIEFIYITPWFDSTSNQDSFTRDTTLNFTEKKKNGTRIPILSAFLFYSNDESGKRENNYTPR